MHRCEEGKRTNELIPINIQTHIFEFALSSLGEGGRGGSAGVTNTCTAVSILHNMIHYLAQN